MSLRGPSMPDELHFLCMLHNIGATSSDRSLTVEEISRWTAIGTGKLRKILQKLDDTNDIQVSFIEGVKKYHVTANGIRKVLSMYS